MGIRIMFRLNNPITISSAPPILINSVWYVEKKCPIIDEDKPNATKIKENPKTKLIA
jgi:hypothetical protein